MSCTKAQLHPDKHTGTHTCTRVCPRVYVHVCMSTCVCVCVCVCMRALMLSAQAHTGIFILSSRVIAAELEHLRRAVGALIFSQGLVTRQRLVVLLSAYVERGGGGKGRRRGEEEGVKEGGRVRQDVQFASARDR